MITSTKLWITLLAVGMLVAPPAPAGETSAPACGQVNASLGCDKTPGGLVVTLPGEVSRAAHARGIRR